MSNYGTDASLTVPISLEFDVDVDDDGAVVDRPSGRIREGILRVSVELHAQRLVLFAGRRQGQGPGGPEGPPRAPPGPPRAPRAPQMTKNNEK